MWRLLGIMQRVEVNRLINLKTFFTNTEKKGADNKDSVDESKWNGDIANS